MLTTEMQRLRRDEAMGLTELELLLQRNELARLLEDFRRELAAQIADRLDRGDLADAADTPPMTRDLLALSAVELNELRRTVQPLARQLAARIGRRRRQRATGRLDARTTARRSLQTGGVPLDPAWRKRHPHRPDVVVLCDVSGSVAEFAQFTFTLVHALHDELARVRSFAFIDGIVEVTDLFEAATHDIHVARLLERRGLIAGDGHSDYGQAFETFCRRHLDDVVTPRTTVLVTGDARTNYRAAGLTPFRSLCQRARRVYWLNPEPEDQWNTDDSAMSAYSPTLRGGLRGALAAAAGRRHRRRRVVTALGGRHATACDIRLLNPLRHQNERTSRWTNRLQRFSVLPCGLIRARPGRWRSSSGWPRASPPRPHPRPARHRHLDPPP